MHNTTRRKFQKGRIDFMDPEETELVHFSCYLTSFVQDDSSIRFEFNGSNLSGKCSIVTASDGRYKGRGDSGHDISSYIDATVDVNMVIQDGHSITLEGLWHDSNDDEPYVVLINAEFV